MIWHCFSVINCMNPYTRPNTKYSYWTFVGEIFTWCGRGKRTGKTRWEGSEPGRHVGRGVNREDTSGEEWTGTTRREGSEAGWYAWRGMNRDDTCPIIQFHGWLQEFSRKSGTQNWIIKTAEEVCSVFKAWKKENFSVLLSNMWCGPLFRKFLWAVPHTA
jgi:hypothetical protein